MDLKLNQLITIESALSLFLQHDIQVYVPGVAGVSTCTAIGGSARRRRRYRCNMFYRQVKHELTFIVCGDRIKHFH